MILDFTPLRTSLFPLQWLFLNFLSLSLSFCLMTPFPYFLFTLGLCSSVFLSPLSTISLSDPFNSPLPRSICSSALSVLTLCSLRSPLP